MRASWLNHPWIQRGRTMAAFAHGKDKRGNTSIVEHLDRVAELVVECSSELGTTWAEAAATAYGTILVRQGKGPLLAQYITAATATGIGQLLMRRAGESSDAYFARLATSGPAVIAIKLAQRIAQLEDPVDDEPVSEDWSGIAVMRKPGQFSDLWAQYDGLT